MKQIKVGDILKLKVECLNNSIGAEGVVYYCYDDGFQVIFFNGSYDGCSLKNIVNIKGKEIIEADYFLEYVSHSESLENYKFINVMQVMKDFGNGYFFE